MKTKTKRIACLFFTSLLGFAVIPFCQAQDYPQKTVRLVIPYAPGGLDIFGRVLAEGFSKRWKQVMIVENVVGAGGLIGVGSVVRSAPDGYTLLFVADGPITSNPHLLKSMPYDTLKDLAPISLLVKNNTFVTVNPAVRAATLRELVGLAKQKPDELNYSSYGQGSPPQLFFEALKAETGSQIRHIPYKGAVAANTATITGEVQMGVFGASVLPLIRAGKLKLIAVCGANRLPALPEIETCTEAGFPKADPNGWTGIFAPAGMPPALISRIHADVAAVMNSPEIVAGRGYEKDAYSGFSSAASTTPAEFARFIREDFEFKGRLIRNAGIAPE